MIRTIRFLLLSFAGLMIAYVVFVVAMRLRGPTEVQQAALATLRQATPPVAGRDASDAVWLLGHEVPPEQHAAVAGDLRRYHDHGSALSSAGRDEEASKLVNPLSRFAERPRIDSDEAGLCQDSTPGCLELARANPSAVNAALKKHDSGIQATLSLSAYDGFRVGRAPSIDMPMPRYGGERRAVATYFGSLFVAGKKAEALTGLCADLAGWRRFGAGTDTLIASMVGAAYARNDLRLLAEMLAELPRDEPLPEACHTALAPMQDAELSVCDAMRGEFRFIEATIRQRMSGADEPWADRLMMSVAADTDRIPMAVAPAYARHCDPKLHQLIKQDKSWRVVGPAPKVCSTLDLVADPITCMLMDLTSGNDFSQYVDRRTDLAAALALTRTVLWLRTQASEPMDWPAKLRERPASLGLRREPVISEDGRNISIALLDKSRDDTLSIPLPASRLLPAADTR